MKHQVPRLCRKPLTKDIRATQTGIGLCRLGCFASFSHRRWRKIAALLPPPRNDGRRLLKQIAPIRILGLDHASFGRRDPALAEPERAMGRIATSPTESVFPR